MGVICKTYHLEDVEKMQFVEGLKPWKLFPIMPMSLMNSLRTSTAGKVLRKNAFDDAQRLL
jgi:hypothetical protein